MKAVVSHEGLLHYFKSDHQGCLATARCLRLDTAPVCSLVVGDDAHQNSIPVCSGDSNPMYKCSRSSDYGMVKPDGLGRQRPY